MMLLDYTMSLKSLFLYSLGLLGSLCLLGLGIFKLMDK